MLPEKFPNINLVAVVYGDDDSVKSTNEAKGLIASYPDLDAIIAPTTVGVVAGLVSRPVIAVPTSVGYGVSLGGLTALFGMLSSCSSNVAVVNIDNGFGAGYMASCINRV